MEILLAQRQGQQIVLLRDNEPQGKNIYQRIHKIRNFSNDFVVCSMNKWGQQWIANIYVYLKEYFNVAL